jgi:hypothetical protein
MEMFLQFYVLVVYYWGLFKEKGPRARISIANNRGVKFYG